MQTQHNDMTRDRINELCDMILVYEDNLDLKKSQEYIERHIRENIVFSGDLYDIRSYVQSKVESYIDNADSNIPVFSFAEDNRFQKYRKQFKDYYYQVYGDVHEPKNSEVSSLVYPVEFGYVFDAIQEYINYHSIYYALTIKIIDDVKQHTTKEVSDAVDTAKANASDAVAKAKEVVDTARTNASVAIAKAKEAADNAADEAIKQIINEKKLEKSIEENIDDQMIKVTSKISETSVTILGIFAGIVLTIVAGLFYSSSVLDNIKGTDLHKLIIVASLVGFVCINIIAIMFNYIDKFRTNKISVTTNKDNSADASSESQKTLGGNYEASDNKKENDRKERSKAKFRYIWSAMCEKFREICNKLYEHLFVVIIDVILIAAMIWAGCRYDGPSSDELIADNTQKNNSNVTVDININQQESITDSNTIDTTFVIEETEHTEPTESN